MDPKIEKSKVNLVKIQRKQKRKETKWNISNIRNQQTTETYFPKIFFESWKKKSFFGVKPVEWSSRMSQRIGMPHRIAEMHPQSCITLTSNWWHGASNVNTENIRDDDDDDDDDDGGGGGDDFVIKNSQGLWEFDTLGSKKTQLGYTKSNQSLDKKCRLSIWSLCKIEAIANPFPSRKLWFASSRTPYAEKWIPFPALFVARIPPATFGDTGRAPKGLSFQSG